MRYLRQTLRRIPTTYLAIYVAAADITLLAGAIPFELYLQRTAVQNNADMRVLLLLLLANLAMLLFALSGMFASSLLLGRGALKVSTVLKVFLHLPRPVFVPLRPSRPNDLRVLRRHP